MKSLSYLFVFALLGPCGIYAQQEKVGVNTTNPKATLDVEGDLRIGKVEENTGAPTNRLLTADDNGVVKTINNTNFGAMGTTKVAAVGLRTKTSGSNSGGFGKTVIYDSDKVSLDVYELSYDGNTGMFTVNKEGYYFLNAFHNILVSEDASGSEGTASTWVYATPKGGRQVQIGGETSGHGYGTNAISHSIGTAAFLKKDDVIRVNTAYKQNFKIANGNITFIYLGEKGK